MEYQLAYLRGMTRCLQHETRFSVARRCRIVRLLGGGRLRAHMGRNLRRRQATQCKAHNKRRDSNGTMVPGYFHHGSPNEPVDGAKRITQFVARMYCTGTRFALRTVTCILPFNAGGRMHMPLPTVIV